jgi:starch-binding outer membrane protein, SusD/RagB family
MAACKWESDLTYPGYEARMWNDKLYLLPIPSQELALNSNFEQNPGRE